MSQRRQPCLMLTISGSSGVRVPLNESSRRLRKIEYERNTTFRTPVSPWTDEADDLKIAITMEEARLVLDTCGLKALPITKKRRKV